MVNKKGSYINNKNQMMSSIEQLKKLQKKIKDGQKKLDLLIIESESEGLVLSINGKYEIEKVDIEKNSFLYNMFDEFERKNIEKHVFLSIQKALKEIKIKQKEFMGI